MEKIETDAITFYARTASQFTEHAPTVLYFSVSGIDSLTQDPLNQPVEALLRLGARVLSCDLPFHLKGVEPHTALGQWKESILAGHDFVTPFVHDVLKGLEQLQPRIDPTRFGVMGLSRGAFLGLHLLAQLPHPRHLLAFAPMTQISLLDPSATTHRLDTIHLLDTLVPSTIRAYIGNLDQRVDVTACFSLLHRLADLAKKRREKLSYECMIQESIGYKGHGTSLETFTAGASWLHALITPPKE